MLRPSARSAHTRPSRPKTGWSPAPWRRPGRRRGGRRKPSNRTTPRGNASATGPCRGATGKRSWRAASISRRCGMRRPPRLRIASVSCVWWDVTASGTVAEPPSRSGSRATGSVAPPRAGGAAPRLALARAGRRRDAAGAAGNPPGRGPDRSCHGQPSARSRRDHEPGRSVHPRRGVVSAASVGHGVGSTRAPAGRAAPVARGEGYASGRGGSQRGA